MNETSGDMRRLDTHIKIWGHHVC